MNETILLKQFDGMTVTPKDDALLYDVAIGENGIFKGGDLTYLGAGQIRISAGRGIIKGRQFAILEQTITVDLSQSGSCPGRLYIRMDLSDTQAPIKLLSETAETLSDLIQDEMCNYRNGIYEIELGTYTATTLQLKNLEKTITEIGAPYKKDIIDTWEGVKAVTEEKIPVGCKAMQEAMGNCTLSVQEDGAYITYTPPGGADAVTKKLGSGTPTAVTLPYTATEDGAAVAFCSCLCKDNSGATVTSTVAIRDMTTGRNLVTATSTAVAGVTYSSIPGAAAVALIAGHQYALVDVQNPPYSKYGHLYIVT